MLSSFNKLNNKISNSAAIHQNENKNQKNFFEENKQKQKRFSLQNQFSNEKQKINLENEQTSNLQQRQKKYLHQSQRNIDVEKDQITQNQQEEIDNQSQKAQNLMNANNFCEEKKIQEQILLDQDNFQNNQNYIFSNPFIKQNLKNALKLLHSNKNIEKEIEKTLNYSKYKRKQQLLSFIFDSKKQIQHQKFEQDKKVAYSARYIINKLCFKENGAIDIQQVIYFMIKKQLDIVLSLKKHKITQYSDEFHNKNSRFFYSLKACVARYLLQGDSKTKFLYKFLKNLAIHNNLTLFTERDWYKSYVQIIPTNEIDDFGMCIPFSRIKIKYNELKNILQQLQLYTIQNFQQVGETLQNNDSEEVEDEEINTQLSKFKINFYLIKEVLIADSLGLVFNKEHFSSQRCFGESLHIQNENILSIEAFQAIQNSKIMWIRKVCNLMYSRMPISKHLSLPTWIQFDCKNGVLYLEGIPSHQDVHDILIRVYDLSKQIIMQYNLSILDEKKRSKDSIKLLIESYNNSNSFNNNKKINLAREIIEKQISNQQINKNFSLTSFQQKSYMNNQQKSTFSSFQQKIDSNNNITDHFSNNQIKQTNDNQDRHSEQDFSMSDKQINEEYQVRNLEGSSLETKQLNNNQSFSVYCSPKFDSFQMLNNTNKILFKKNILYKSSSFKIEQNQYYNNQNYTEHSIQIPSQDQLNINIPESLKIKNHLKNTKINSNHLY